MEEELSQYKRSYVGWDGSPYKRNVEALARAGYLKTLPEDEDDTDSSLKRSIANLAKNGQIPIFHSGRDSKRGIEALARNGELHHKREPQGFYDKRYLGSLAKNFDLPSYGKRFVGTLARDGVKVNGKRNAAALLRQDSYERDEENKNEEDSDGSKRNIGSVKAQFGRKFKREVQGDEEKKNRNKREVDYYDDLNEEYPVPVYQNQNLYEFEKFFNALMGTDADRNKRFLGE